MGISRILKDQINYLIFNEIYLRFTKPKAKQKAFAILEACIHCLNRKSFDEITLQMIATEAGVSRPLIKYYFTDLESLLNTALKYIRLKFQKQVVDAMETQGNEKQKLIKYIISCFEWLENNRTHAIVWLSFLSQCTRRPSFRHLNTLAVATGEERLQKLLIEGKRHGFFQFETAEVTGKMIQSLITGALITSATENLKDPQTYRQAVQDQCLVMAGFKSK